ncbi:hypothetical protein Vretimale_2115 [Volvox reticuliferus]|uniref:Uncharacterized protein n=1 Tax=Volvox reticuliferus TaxID=1737510 RepID=A0A8J4D727_9CHLO|nr:hypothetical protein Vretifemale_4394 [Volvox reticuliferus]GIL96275.1 hypothetical protein Vretimale_2115 [Volvox reticuliferus]
MTWPASSSPVPWSMIIVIDPIQNLSRAAASGIEQQPAAGPQQQVQQQEQPAAWQQQQQHLRPSPRSNQSRVVNWMREVAEAVVFPNSALADAVTLFDHFMATTEVAPPETLLQLLALASMSLAFKQNNAGESPTV